MVALGTGAIELGAITQMFFAFRERERVLDIFEMISGLRMNMAYIRPGGVQQDLPAGATQKIRETVKEMRTAFKDNSTLLIGNFLICNHNWSTREFVDLVACLFDDAK